MRKLVLGWILCLVPVVGAGDGSRPPLEAVLQELNAVRRYSDVAISPDGRRVAYVEGGAILVHDRSRGNASPRRLDAGEEEHDLAWSPDSTRLAFLAKGAKDGQVQLYAAAAHGGSPRRLATLSGYLAAPRWSPDSTRVAVLYAEGSPAGGGPLLAVPPQTGVIESRVYNQRIAVIDGKSGRVEQASPPELHVYEYDWSPDGRSFAATAAPGPGDNNYWIARLYTVPSGGGKASEVYRPKLQIAAPRWSPDGSRIAFIEGLMSDQGFTGGDVFTVPARGGEAINRTAGRKASASWISWLSVEKLMVTEWLGGGSAISTLDLKTGDSERLWRGDESLHAGGNFPNFSLAGDGRTAAAVRSDWQHAPEVWAGPIGEWRAVTKANSRLRPQWGEARNIEWTSEGHAAQGWLLYPRGYDPARSYPLIVEVHGGPAGSRKPSWPHSDFDGAVLASQGYLVFFPNPRGSYGQGEDFTRANVKDFGGGDLRDILAGVDAVEKAARVDGKRVGITGWSYGGYMTMFAVTQTRRFRAAVAGAGIANWQSYYGENSIDQWMIPYFGASVYDDPAAYSKSSPITFIKNVITPTLVVVGERDGECPAPQSFEFWHALKTLGVPSELVVYKDEGHMFQRAQNKLDVLERTAAWFEKYLK